MTKPKYVVKYGDIYCMSTFLDTEISLKIIHKKEAFSTKLSSTDFSSSFTTEETQKMANEAFKSLQSCYSISFNSDKSSLIWYKLSSKGARIRLATIQLELIDFDVGQSEVLDFLIQTGSSNEKKVQALEQELKQKTLDLERSIKLNKQIEASQNKSIDELINKFVPILNAKKKMIVDLESQLQSRAVDVSSTGPRRCEEGVEESDDAYDRETDDDPDDPMSDGNNTEDVDDRGGEKRKKVSVESYERSKSAKLDDSLDDNLFETI